MSYELRDPPRLQLSFYSLRLPRFPRESNPVREGDWAANYELCIMNYELCIKRPSPPLNRLCIPSALLLPRFAGEGNPVREREGYRIVFFTFQH